MMMGHGERHDGKPVREKAISAFLDDMLRAALATAMRRDGRRDSSGQVKFLGR